MRTTWTEKLKAKLNFKNPLVFIAWKLLFTRKFILEGSTPLSLLGLILGVACLLVSMAVMSGFEATLKKTMTDVTGHIQIVDKFRRWWHGVL